MTQVFISYPSKDPSVAAHVEALRQAISDRGWKPWIDKSGVQAGDHVAETIRAAALDCRTCVVIIPESGLATDWMYQETNAFWWQNKKIFVLDPWMDTRPIRGLPEALYSFRKEQHLDPILRVLENELGSTLASQPHQDHRRQQFARHALDEVRDLAERRAYAQLLNLGPVLQRHLFLILQFEEMVNLAALVKHAADQRAAAENRDPTFDDLEKEMSAQADGVGWGQVLLGRFDAANDAFEVANASLAELRDHGATTVPYWTTKVLRHRGALLVHQAYRATESQVRQSLLQHALNKLFEAQHSAASIPDGPGGSGGLNGRQDMLAGIDHDLALAYIALSDYDNARGSLDRLDSVSQRWSADKSCRIPLLKAWLQHRQSTEGATSVHIQHKNRAVIQYELAITKARTAARWDIALWGCAGIATLAENPKKREQFAHEYRTIRREWVASDAVHDAMLHRGPVVGLRDD